MRGQKISESLKPVYKASLKEDRKLKRTSNPIVVEIFAEMPPLPYVKKGEWELIYTTYLLEREEL